jgi:ABC-2 type transport system permease protein
MTFVLVRKVLRDLRVPLVLVALLLAGFELLWAKVTERLTHHVADQVKKSIPWEQFINMLFSEAGKIIQVLLGGESLGIDRPADVLSIGYLHPFILTILCIWAIGRSASAIAGELDRGTMELLLAQPLARYRLVLAHLCVDLITIPVLCLGMWGGTWLGTWLFGLLEWGAPLGPGSKMVDPWVLAPGLWNVAGLLFAVSGYTLWLSAAGRFRSRVLGLAILLTLVQFLVNVIAQLADQFGWLRPFTVFYYFQPHLVNLHNRWSVDLGQVWLLVAPHFRVNVLAVLFGVGGAGYALALWTFCRRDLPAPL